MAAIPHNHEDLPQSGHSSYNHNDHSTRETDLEEDVRDALDSDRRWGLRSSSPMKHIEVSIAQDEWDTRRQERRDTDDAQGPYFEVLRSASSTSASGIDIEEEIRLYEELCREYDEEARSFDRRSQSLRNVAPISASRPADSIFTSDIYLSDNRGAEVGSFAKDVKITGWTTVAGDRVPSLRKGKSLTGVGSGAYVVYDCVVTTKENTTFHFLKRYSAFEDLDWALRKTVHSSLLPSIPQLPPKAPFARFRPTFLDRRRQHLQFWLARIILHPEISQTEAVKRWVMS